MNLIKKELLCAMKKSKVISFILVMAVALIVAIPSQSLAAVSFKDVSSTDRTYEEISYLTENRIVFGTNDGYFLPRENVTRAAAAAMIGRALGLNGAVKNTRFSDVSSNVFASGYIEELSKYGIVSGYLGGTFKPGNSIKRGEAAIMIARAFKLGTATKSSQAAALLMQKGIASGKADGTFGELELITRQDLSVFIANAMKQGIPNWVSSDVNDIRNQTIIIDPGHGGNDPGAEGYGLLEKDVVLDISKRANSLFANTPFNVKMTRYNDVFIELEDRVAYAKQNSGDVFVSVHANAFNGTADGTETYYYSAASNPYSSDSRLLAEKVQKHMLDALGLDNRGVKDANFYVLKYNSMPAVLAEMGFIDNKNDAQKLASSTYRTKAAKAIYLGVLDYYEAKGFDVKYYKQ
jgi:N-acetylmuramoyl-L-alanine amidase